MKLISKIKKLSFSAALATGTLVAAAMLTPAVASAHNHHERNNQSERGHGNQSQNRYQNRHQAQPRPAEPHNIRRYNPPHGFSRSVSHPQYRRFVQPHISYYQAAPHRSIISFTPHQLSLLFGITDNVGIIVSP